MQHLPREKYETDDKFSAPVIRVTFFLRQFFSNTFDLQSSIIPFTTKKSLHNQENRSFKLYKRLCKCVFFGLLFENIVGNNRKVEKSP